MELADHLFRREWGRMVAALTRIFGVHNLTQVEDVVQEAFCRAIEVWRVRGIPENPSAWLMATAKHCAFDIFRRRNTERKFAHELGRVLDNESTTEPVVEELFGSTAIKDDLLRMMFSCCNPRLPKESQVALVLHILCGFSVAEIANALVTRHAAIEKRIIRAKHTLSQSAQLFDLAHAEDFSRRLPIVQQALYLVFNEGYHGTSSVAVRTDLCGEAMRLTAMLLAHPLGRCPTSFALSSLMCLHAARMPARLDPSGNLVAFVNQDRSHWDPDLIGEGLALLELSATGEELSAFHLEAAIAAVHCAAAQPEQTDWSRIASLYDVLLQVSPSPIVALNRAIAIGQLEGPERGIEELHAITDRERLSAYPFYLAALGEFELRCGRAAAAVERFRAASALARNSAERRFLDQRALDSARLDLRALEPAQFWDYVLDSFKEYLPSDESLRP
jgi:RNA polymerase sigma factor (sigma-70 family)